MKSNYKVLRVLRKPVSKRNQAWSWIVIAGVVGMAGCGATEDAGESTPDGGDVSTTQGQNSSTEQVLTTPTTGHLGSSAQSNASSAGADSDTNDGEATDSNGELSTSCGGDPCACNDGLDNDGDGVFDGMDPECTGPFDDEEETFATGIPGDNRDPKWQDCFFDGNSGAGDDGCRYHTDCLTGDKPADDQACTLAQACIDFCRPLTPPSCDCFGCCEVPFEGASVGVQLSDDCSLDKLRDTDACPRCTLATACSNECGECELCLGKTLEDLPASCGDKDTPPTGGDAGTPHSDDGGGTPTGDASQDVPPMVPLVPPVNACDNNEPCASNTDCSAGGYCRLGCCVDYTPQVF